jgi:hypothetical protein
MIWHTNFLFAQRKNMQWATDNVCPFLFFSDNMFMTARNLDKKYSVQLRKLKENKYYYLTKAPQFVKLIQNFTVFFILMYKI